MAAFGCAAIATLGQLPYTPFTAFDSLACEWRRVPVQKNRLTWLLVLSLAGLPARAEEIQLKDGTKVTGKLVSINGDSFQVKTAYGDIQVPRAQILSIEFPEE